MKKNEKNREVKQKLEDKLHIEGTLDDVLKVSVPKSKDKETK